MKKFHRSAVLVAEEMLYVVAEPAHSKQKPTGAVQLPKGHLTAHLKCRSPMVKEDAKCWPPSQRQEEVMQGYSVSCIS